MPVIEMTVAAAKTVLAPEDQGPLGGAPAEEVALVERWIAEPGARLVSTTEPLESPIGSAQRWTEFSLAARRARDAPGPAPARVGA